MEVEKAEAPVSPWPVSGRALSFISPLGISKAAVGEGAEDCVPILMREDVMSGILGYISISRDVI